MCPQLRECHPKNFSQKCFKVDAYASEGKEKRQKASQWRHEPAPWKLALEENLIQFNSNAAQQNRVLDLEIAAWKVSRSAFTIVPNDESILTTRRLTRDEL